MLSGKILVVVKRGRGNRPPENESEEKGNCRSFL
jgi:hypothetical protein